MCLMQKNTFLLQKAYYKKGAVDKYCAFLFLTISITINFVIIELQYFSLF